MPLHFISQSAPGAPTHTAIIMDGNGRWASARGLSRFAGHRAGAHALRRVVESAPTLGIETLTVYAFSSDNWNRPASETNALMELLAHHLATEADHCGREGVRMTLIGRRDRLPAAVIEAAEVAERGTSGGTALHLRLAIDYSARHAIRASEVGQDVDLLIRTGGEQRLSDFLLWECAYAELVFTTRMWPEFTGEDLAGAVQIFQSRERRFGNIDALGQLWSRDASTPVSDLRRDRWLR